MSLYFDASALVAIIADEPSSQAVYETLRHGERLPLVSDFCRAEASAALAKRVRTGAAQLGDIDLFYADLDHWALNAGEAVKVSSADIHRAAELVRHRELALRAPDAIHIAAAHRLGATLLTLDRGLARAAAALGVPYLNPGEADAPGEPKD
ncbi:type II toxin-antitoxin system VapC family toxin [Brevundimonas bacteroides]|uniref:type II toxin-antitoxin system VapC family toxin n=1 Tax=Brevundimonas bacteroides TaxID=74311 RepID=UPI000495363F|nr:type II toxin-antitoxin system VapC family toxin [Brevundimonas bacteroides]